MNEPARLGEVAARFALAGPVRRVVRYGSGHIHDTYLVESAGSRYVLQRLNAAVFPDLDAVMHNVERVTGHLRRRLEARGAADVERRCLRLVATREGAVSVDAEGGRWRLWHFVEGTHTRDTADRPEPAYAAARACGAFLAELADLPPPALEETLPRFHDLAWRRDALESAVRDDRLGRAAAVAAETDRASRLAERVAVALDAAGHGEAPRRVVHNDCKLNNVLLDDVTGEGVCVIDLDTVMEGMALFDFGELVRTAACPAPEDTRDLAAIRVDPAVVDALARGYLAGAGALLEVTEVAGLPLAGPRMALENGVRFLTDHLEGDRYFRVARAGHNLDRARAQLALVERLFEGLDAARGAVARARAQGRSSEAPG